ncbi:MAG TPA: alpha/beta hydrolase [Candidatus Binataceae bacterium]|nr:alpha/beta hydrolase [Candidatus Binataceae bacterium]
MDFPDPLKTIDAVMHDGAVVRIRQHGDPGGPRLALSHGNGLAIDGYLPFWEPLCGHYEVIVFDFRNHGQNPTHLLEHHVWPNFIRDSQVIFETIQREFGVKRTAGVFHSLSAVTAAAFSQQAGPRWDPLVLFDPPVYPPEDHPLVRNQLGDKDDLANRAARRTQRFKTPTDLARQFAVRLAGWVPEAYELMARATLRRDPDVGDWVLACPREYEAQVFRGNRNPATWNAMGRIPVAVKLICADPNVEGQVPAQLCAALAAATPSLEYAMLPGSTHFLQIERPAECARLMQDFLAAQGFFTI